MRYNFCQTTAIISYLAMFSGKSFLHIKELRKIYQYSKAALMFINVVIDLFNALIGWKITEALTNT